MHDAITDVAGIRVGHYTDRTGATGCTVVLCEDGAMAGVDIRGGAPGTRDCEILRPGNRVPEVHAILLTGGGAFGLDAAAGVMSYLAERGRGFSVAAGIAVPIVPAAVIFDLSVGDRTYPRPENARAACEQASDGPVAEGSVGAGTGATVGKLFGPAYRMKGGLGTASERLPNGTIVGALAVVNALGDVIDPAGGRTIAGAWHSKGGFLDAGRQMRHGLGPDSAGLPGRLANTTLAVVATNAPLDKDQVTRLAAQAQNGLVRTIRPANTLMDGDMVFSLATGLGPESNPDVLGLVAADVLVRAIVRGVRQAESLLGLPTAASIG